MAKSRNRKKKRKNTNTRVNLQKWTPSKYDIDWIDNLFNRIVDGVLWNGDFGSIQKINNDTYKVVSIKEKETIRRTRICLSRIGYSELQSNQNSTILSDNTILNAVMYKVPNMDVVLSSANMNMTFKEYTTRSNGISSVMKDENWILDKTDSQNGHIFKLYKCKNGSFIELQN